MNVEIGAEAALFPGKEYIIGIAVAVQRDGQDGFHGFHGHVCANCSLLTKLSIRYA
jgi:hypothetical protein